MKTCSQKQNPKIHLPFLPLKQKKRAFPPSSLATNQELLASGLCVHHDIVQAPTGRDLQRSGCFLHLHLDQLGHETVHLAAVKLNPTRTTTRKT
jgi:hypothetical protein